MPGRFAVFNLLSLPWEFDASEFDRRICPPVPVDFVQTHGFGRASSGTAGLSGRDAAEGLV